MLNLGDKVRVKNDRFHILQGMTGQVVALYEGIAVVRFDNVRFSVSIFIAFNPEIVTSMDILPIPVSYLEVIN